MTKITGIDIRKGILAVGLNPNDYDEEAILEDCISSSIDDWEFESQILMVGGNTKQFETRYLLLGAMECEDCIYRDQVLGLPPDHTHGR